jgi:hypothetical protein
MRVYHLSDANHALNNVALRRLKISRIDDLNDPFELMGADLRDKEQRHAFRKSREEIHSGKGLICFSRSWGNPMIWSHYADKHRGICLGFDVNDSVLRSVDYIEKPLKIEFQETAKGLRLKQSFVTSLLYSKFSSWKYEEEERSYVRLDPKTKEGGLYFLPFSQQMCLREVILGPRCELPLKQVRALVEGFESPVHVTKSRLAFTKFKVVENRAATRRGAQ